MTNDVKKALAEIDTSYKDLIVIGNGITDRYCKEVDETIKFIHDNVETLTDEDIRKSILKLSMASYSFGDVKEKSAFKSDIADAVKKVAYSQSFNSSEGAIAVRENTSIVNTAEQILASEICNYVASFLKTKLDEIHRCVDSLKSVLISRQAEAKNLRQIEGMGELQ